MKLMKRFTTMAAAVLILALPLSACSFNSGTHMEGSRATIYSDLSSLVADSVAVAEVEVTSQEVATSDADYTLSTAKVLSTYAPQGLAEAMSGPSNISSSEEIVIRQMGSPSYASTPAPLLKEGETYLLFLSPSGQKGDPAQFYVTGASAGIYILRDGAFVHIASDDGDVLPETLTSADLALPADH